MRRYTTRYRCVKCRGYMSWNTKMNSHGTCPMCGHHKGGTVCAVETEVGQWVRRWWWRRREWLPKGAGL